MKKSILERIGLGSNESIVYENLIKGGASSISDIVRSSKLHRPSAYKAIGTLLEYGLVLVVPHGKQKRYMAESPLKIRQLFDKLRSDMEGDILSLESRYSKTGEKPHITYGEGPVAIEKVYSDVVNDLKPNEMYYRYSSAKVLNREKYVPKNYREIRDRKNLERLVITNEHTKKGHSNKLGRLIKAVPTDFDLFEYDIAQIIYGNKVAIIDYNTTSAIVIENAVIAEFQKKLFKLLFKKL
jgi:sugar-specific transcriptional regulator TrmB